MRCNPSFKYNFKYNFQTQAGNLFVDHNVQIYYVAIAFAGVVISHARGVGSSVSMANLCHPSPDPFLDEQVFIDILEKF